MAIEFVPFTSMAPDSGSYGQQELLYVENAIPCGGYFSPILQVFPYGGNYQTLLSDTSFSVDRYLGMHVNPKSLFALTKLTLGTKTKLMDEQGNDRTRAVGGSYATSLTSGYGWQFVSYGDKVIATNFVDDIQTGTGTAQFTKNNVTTSPTSADPKARFLAILKSHLVLGGFSLSGSFGSLSATDYPKSIWISATDDETRFGSLVDTPSLIQTEFIHFYDGYGNITGLSGGESLTVFKERAIYSVEGPPYNVRVIAIGRGTLFPNSICKHHDDVYFWGNTGPAVLHPTGEVEELGGEKFKRQLSVYLNTNEALYYVCSAVSNIHNKVYFGFPRSSAGNGASALFDGPLVAVIDIATGEGSFLNFRSAWDTDTFGSDGDVVTPFSSGTLSAPLLMKEGTYLAAPVAPNADFCSDLIMMGMHDSNKWALINFAYSSPFATLGGMRPAFSTKMFRPTNLPEESSFKIKRLKLVYGLKRAYLPDSTSAHAPVQAWTIKALNSANPSNSQIISTTASGPNSPDEWTSVDDNDTFSKLKMISVTDKGFTSLTEQNDISGFLYEYEAGGKNR